MTTTTTIIAITNFIGITLFKTVIKCFTEPNKIAHTVRIKTTKAQIKQNIRPEKIKVYNKNMKVIRDRN